MDRFEDEPAAARGDGLSCDARRPRPRRGAAETRVALVIGNGAYANSIRCQNPVNDASDIADALKGSASR